MADNKIKYQFLSSVAIPIITMIITATVSISTVNITNNNSLRMLEMQYEFKSIDSKNEIIDDYIKFFAKQKANEKFNSFNHLSISDFKEYKEIYYRMKTIISDPETIKLLKSIDSNVESDLWLVVFDDVEKLLESLYSETQETN